MKKTVYIPGILLGFFLNLIERGACLLSYRKPPRNIQIKKVRFGKPRSKRFHFLNDKTDNRKRPLMIYIHGGGFVSGLLDFRDPYCIEWVKKGFAVANIDYEYAPKAVFPQQIRECFEAIENVLDYARERNIDTETVLLAGESAGVYFAYYIATVTNDLSYFRKLKINFKYKDSFRVGAVISICGASTLQGAMKSGLPGIRIMIRSFTGKTEAEMNQKGIEEIDIISPPINEKIPPSVLIYATKDPLKEESLKLAEKLTEAGVPNILLEANGRIAQHAWAISTRFKRSRELIDESAAFLRSYFDGIS